jgi:hypothetical protein
MLRRHAALFLLVAAFVLGTSFVLLGGSYDASGWKRAVFWSGLALKLPFSATAEIVELVLGRVLGDAGVEIVSAFVLLAGAALFDLLRDKRSRAKG